MDQSWGKTIWSGAGGTILAALIAAWVVYATQTPKAGAPAKLPDVVAEAKPLPKPEVKHFLASEEPPAVQTVAAHEPVRKSVLQPFPLTIEVRYSLYFLEGRHVRMDDIIKLLKWGAFDGNGCDVRIDQYDQSEPNAKASKVLEEAIKNSGVFPQNIQTGIRRSVLAD